MSRVLTLILACAALLAGNCQAVESLASATSGLTRWEVTAPLSFMPTAGFMPLTISATNTDSEGIKASYNIALDDHRYGSKTTTVASGSLDVPAGKSASATHWVWCGSQYHRGRRSHFNFTFNSPSGTSAGTLMGKDDGGLSIAFSRSFIKDNRVPGLTPTSGGHYGYAGEVVAMFDPKSLPADWRIFSSLHGIFIRPADWDDMSPGVRDAMRTWVGFGGFVRIVDDDGAGGERVASELAPNAAALGVFAHRDAVGVVSYRRIRTDANDIRAMALAVGVPEPVGEARRGRNRYASSWDHDHAPQRRGHFPLRDAFGARGIPYFVICMLLIVFAVLVGPVSLRMWAGPGRRHRLFFTTPLLSAVTSGLLLIVMLFQDGLGIDGRRFTLIDLAPADSPPTALIYQEQFARAGMIAGGGFELEKGLVPILPYTWEREDLSVRDGRATGSWFSSRRDRSLALAGAAAVRWKVTHEGITGGSGEDVLRLRVESPITEFESAWFVDGEGLVWKWVDRGSVEDGEFELIPAGKDIDSLLEPMFSRCSSGLRGFVVGKMEQPNQRNRFWAMVKDGSSVARPTHKKIDWKESQLVLTSKVIPPA